jgi:hypothetical protein
MTARLIAFVIVVVIGIAALAASEQEATNYGLPLVQSQPPQFDDPSAEPHMLVAPCPVEPMNRHDYSERSA